MTDLWTNRKNPLCYWDVNEMCDDLDSVP